MSMMGAAGGSSAWNRSSQGCSINVVRPRLSIQSDALRW
jgi:hypothetical protein